MRYYIVADGGGTKLQVILYNENLEIVSIAKGSGTNHLFKSKSDIEKEISALIEKLIPKSIKEIEALDLTIIGSSEAFESAVKERCRVKDITHRGEGSTPLAASGHLYGITAQAGTGSDAFMVQPENRFSIGGWGAVLGDEGSGYDIGLNSLKAAIHCYDGRGEKTLIYDILMEEWKLSELRDIIFKISNSSDYRGLIASVSYITEKAAKMGDSVALKIYENAAHAMSLQVLTVIKQNGGKWAGPIVCSGGAWKGSKRMFDAFSENIKRIYPNTDIIYPTFEPVVGCVILRMCDTGENFIEKFNTYEEKLKVNFKDFLYKKNFQ